MAERRVEGSQVWDGQMWQLAGCPRGRADCTATARRASPGFESYMCCGETNGAPVPTDVLRLCIKSSHDRKPVDILVNLDRRDAIEVSAVLLAGMSGLAQLDAANAFAIDAARASGDAETREDAEQAGDGA